MKVDAYRNIQPGTVFKGHKPVPVEVVLANYNGYYILAGLVRGSVSTPVSDVTIYFSIYELNFYQEFMFCNIYIYI